MFKSLQEFFAANFSTERTDDHVATTHGLELAAAVLMMEIGRADSTIDDEERGIVEQAMRNSFHLSEEEAHALVKLAAAEVDHATSLHEFTSLLNRELAADEKIKIVTLLWQVAFADKVLDKYEEYFIRKIADLLYVSHKDYIKAKHRASW